MLDEVLDMLSEEFAPVDPKYDWHCPCCGCDWRVCPCTADDLIVLKIQTEVI